jgi:hypothetical protein
MLMRSSYSIAFCTTVVVIAAVAVMPLRRAVRMTAVMMAVDAAIIAVCSIEIVAAKTPAVANQRAALSRAALANQRAVAKTTAAVRSAAGCSIAAIGIVAAIAATTAAANQRAALSRPAVHSHRFGLESI